VGRPRSLPQGGQKQVTNSACSTADLRERLTPLVGQQLVAVSPEDGRGFMAAHHRATLADDTHIFIKEATTEFAMSVLESEALAYDAIGPKPFMPNVVAYDGQFLIIEDLAHAYWPPPWREHDLARVQAVLDEIVETRPPGSLRELGPGPWPGSWDRIAEDPAPLLGLGLCSDDWLDQALDLLITTDDCPLAGEVLVHGDFRSDNLCILNHRVIVVDWAAAAKGRPDYDRTSFAIATAVETGQLPERIAPNADPALVATLTSTLACHAPDPQIPQPIRDQLEVQLRVALPWCARVLDLPPQ